MMWIAIVAATTLWWPQTVTRAQTSTTLVDGLKVERSLGPGDNHVYIISLKEGEGVLGEANQHGVDQVIDVFDPDGRQIRSVDSPNGIEGPEPIDLTAFKSGPHKLIIHMLRETEKPGKYVMQIDRILTLEQNGQRLAEKNYPPALQDLWRASLSDPKSVEGFVALKDKSGYVRVTYFYYGDENTEAVRMDGGPHVQTGGLPMRRFQRTPLFFVSQIVPSDARYTYRFTATQTRFVGPQGVIQISDEVRTTDALNSERFDDRSFLVMPSAPAQPYLNKNDSVPHGRLTPASLKSGALNEERNLTVYTPPGYERTKACDLLIVFDGEDHDGGSGSLTPTPTILDNLVAAGKIGPTVAVFVNNIRGKRVRDLTGSPTFADFVGMELISWVRKNYRISPGPGHVVVAGESLGGLSASYCAFRHSENIGNVLSLSGSYWITKDWPNSPDWPLALAGETGDLVVEFRQGRRLPIKFFVAVGRFELGSEMLGTNREFRDVLLLKGYPVTYKEVNGGHDDIWWRGSIADGLIALLARTP